MSTVVRYDESNDTKVDTEPKYRLFCKGASEIVEKLCSNIMTQNGEVTELDDNLTSQLKELIEQYASSGMSHHHYQNMVIFIATIHRVTHHCTCVQRYRRGARLGRRFYYRGPHICWVSRN